MERTIQFGAGNIGRGFMAQHYFEAGYHTVFVESNLELVRSINDRGHYTLRILDAYAKRERDLSINEVSALSTEQTAEVAGLFATARCASTAVGVENLEAVAPLVAAGIVERRRSGNGPIDLFLCENLYGAFLILRDAVMKHLGREDREWAERNVGFVGTSVARMVPAPDPRLTGEDPLLVAADSYQKLPYDGMASRAGSPPAAGMVPVKNFRAEVERKLFTHNLGHAAIGYFGYLKGFTYVSEALEDDEIRGIFDGALRETSQALLSKYPDDLDPEEHEKVLSDVLIRFGNPMLRDRVQRVAHDPVRKLGPSDRLVGSARLCLEQSIAPKNIAFVCAAALRYDFEGDPPAVRLQRLVADAGVGATLSKIAGIDVGGALSRMIEESYEAIVSRFGVGRRKPNL